MNDYILIDESLMALLAAQRDECNAWRKTRAAAIRDARTNRGATNDEARFFGTAVADELHPTVALND